MKYYVSILVISVFVISCTHNPQLKQALKLAGNNRAELQKVLDHYSNDKADSLKLRAAEFLIANMPGHYTLAGGEMEYVREVFCDDSTGSYLSRKAADLSAPFFTSDIETVPEYDISHVTADFLIRHIDLAFEQYYTYPWLDRVAFDVFLEYVLPYRFMHERLDLWRDSLRLDDKTMAEILSCDKARYWPSAVSNFPLPDMRMLDPVAVNSVFGKNILADCYGLTMKALVKYRVMGIPSAVDFIPAYGNRNGYHYWIQYFSPDVKNLETNAVETRVPKVYRFMYSRQNSYEHTEREFVPELFRDEYIMDVTDLYVNTRDVTVRNRIELVPHPENAYLCVFNDRNWYPVAIGEYGRRDLEFENMGYDMVYLPVAYFDGRIADLNHPFILHRDGEIEYLEPDTTALRKLQLTRKYPNNKEVNDFIANVDASYWLASNDPGFADADTVFSYRARNNMAEIVKHGTDSPARRYWKFVYAQKPWTPVLAVGEFMLFDLSGERINISPDEHMQNLFDGDPLTNTTISGEIMLDLGAETAVLKIVCIPRTDGNGIVPGNHYELMYYMSEGWMSLGYRVAEDTWLEYDNVPAGALLWLRNHTMGVEERIFTAKDGEIRFW